MILYPQLPHPVAEHLAQERRDLATPDAAILAYSDHHDVVFTPTGGARATQDDLKQLRESLLAAARASGYPHTGNEPERLRFDEAAGAILHSSMQVEPAEAAKPGIWNFISCVLLCDLVRWRFPGGSDGTPIERFVSGRRNTFQRLWWRAYILFDSKADDPYWLMHQLGEDEVVQIMERPFLAGSRTLSRVVAIELIAAADRHEALTRRTLIRESQKRLRRLAAFISFEAVDEAALGPMVANVFDDVAAAMAGLDSKQPEETAHA